MTSNRSGESLKLPLPWDDDDDWPLQATVDSYVHTEPQPMLPVAPPLPAISEAERWARIDAYCTTLPEQPRGVPFARLLETDEIEALAKRDHADAGLVRAFLTGLAAPDLADDEAIYRRCESDALAKGWGTGTVAAIRFGLDWMSEERTAWSDNQLGVTSNWPAHWSSESQYRGPSKATTAGPGYVTTHTATTRATASTWDASRATPKPSDRHERPASQPRRITEIDAQRALGAPESREVDRGWKPDWSWLRAENRDKAEALRRRLKDEKRHRRHKR